jgi:hypothetical protein
MRKITEIEVKKEFGTTDPVEIGRIIRRAAARSFMEKFVSRKKLRTHLVA